MTEEDCSSTFVESSPVGKFLSWRQSQKGSFNIQVVLDSQVSKSLVSGNGSWRIRLDFYAICGKSLDPKLIQFESFDSVTMLSTSIQSNLYITINTCPTSPSFIFKMSEIIFLLSFFIEFSSCCAASFFKLKEFLTIKK